MWTFLLGALLGVAQAGTVYLNGTPVDGLRNYNFQKVDVRIDEEGNIWIDAPDLKVGLGDDAERMRKKADAEAAPPPEAQTDLPPATWWLVSEDNESTGHAVDVMLNGQLVKTVTSGGKKVVFDITPYLHRGTNVVTFRNHGIRKPGGGALEIYLGTGSVDGGKLTIDRPKMTFKRNSASVGGKSDENQTLVIE